MDPQHPGPRLQELCQSICCPSPSRERSYLLAQILADDLADLFHAALWGLAMQHFQCACVLHWQHMVQSPQVLAHLDEGAPVGTAELTKTPGRAEVHLQGDKSRPETCECSLLHRKHSLPCPSAPISSVPVQARVHTHTHTHPFLYPLRQCPPSVSWQPEQLIPVSY